MSSFWIDEQARQRIEEFAADARGDQLIRDDASPRSRRTLLDRRPSLRLRAWLAAVVRSRRQVARAR
ncbi:MAG TPA: hypothetical protein VFV72_04780 [Candidatus Limnocylindrales bacterium]|nr:hypothetical protein [Candidatus Limnocylindrales bacterium]